MTSSHQVPSHSAPVVFLEQSLFKDINRFSVIHGRILRYLHGVITVTCSALGDRKSVYDSQSLNLQLSGCYAVTPVARVFDFADNIVSLEVFQVQQMDEFKMR